MNDPHTFALLLRGMRDNGTGQRASISLDVDAQTAVRLIRTMGEEVGLGKGCSCDTRGTLIWVGLVSDNLPTGFVHLHVPWTRIAADSIRNLLASVHCLQCGTYVGFDCWDHRLDTYCADCYDTRHIEVEDRHEPGDGELITDDEEVTA